MTWGKLLVILVFALAVTAVFLHFIPSAAMTAFRAPTYHENQGIQFNGIAITWTMVICAFAALGGYKLVKR